MIIHHIIKMCTNCEDHVTAFGSDTDLFILMLFYSWYIPASMYMQNLLKTFSLKTIADTLGLVGLYASSGCDTVGKCAYHGRRPGGTHSLQLEKKLWLP